MKRLWHIVEAYVDSERLFSLMMLVGYDMLIAVAKALWAIMLLLRSLCDK